MMCPNPYCMSVAEPEMRTGLGSTVQSLLALDSRNILIRLAWLADSQDAVKLGSQPLQI